MKTLPGLLLATALAFATTTGASAYSWSPPDASVRLHGKLTFTPNEGGSPFSCSVILDLKTKRSVITAAKFPHGDCEGVHFVGLPWGVDITNANSGTISGGSYLSGDGTCAGTEISFQVDDSGMWTFNAGCLIGSLTSHPPTTIVP